ncbi:hypothetical protein [Desulfonema magnum]|uniref:ParB/Sulfiredoxin domain-containing protein n=1 Tax=Desulfonema magnum TaxID=45655 RepID=A0A975BXE8_9BACT|nr:hypothetical protein [Desulfonema magnum]QTA93488.1 Uncharacterized protein dnm_095890 [Desulfonema magnum]
MRLSPTTIAVKRITSKIPRSNFSEDELTLVAKRILEVEGIINPPVVIETDVRSYEVVDGDFEYYAAVRAREIDLRRGEMLGVFIISPENEACLRDQVRLLRKQPSSEYAPLESDKSEGGIRFTNIESRLTNIESRLESRFEVKMNELASENQGLKKEIQQIKAEKSRQVETPLDIFNLMDKRDMIRIADLSEKIADAVIQERSKEKFESLNHVIKRFKGRKVIGVDKMLKIVDKWYHLKEHFRKISV